MAAKSYTDHQRAQVVVNFEKMLLSKESKKYVHRVDFALNRARELSDINASWPMILKWYASAHHDENTSLSRRYQELKNTV